MPKYYRDLVPYLTTYAGGSAVACGTTSTVVPVPTNANFAIIHPEGGAGYWAIGAASASSGSPGYAAQDTVGYIPPCDNLGTGLPVVGAGTAVVMHVEFYQD